MAWVDGEDQKTSSVGRSLARAKMKRPMGGEGQGAEMTVQKKPEGGFHTIAKHADGTEEHMDHASMEEATQHMHQHFGHKSEKPKHEKEQMPEESPEPMGGEPSMGAMGVEGQ
jgi:hypothetical protein